MLGLGTAVNRGGFVRAAPAAKLLDTYSSAAAAYSLRQLSNSYSGPVLQIRRASDNVEVDVSFDTNGVVSLNSRITNVTEETTGSSTSLTTSATTLGEFVANASYTDADGLGATDSALIQCWYDQSGNSNDSTQNTASAQPTIVSSGALIEENGSPVINFNEDHLLSSAWMTQLSPMSFSLVQVPANVSREVLIGVNTATPYTTAFINWNSGSDFLSPRFYNFPAFEVYSSSMTEDEMNLVFAHSSTTSTSFYLNGSEDSNSPKSHSKTSAADGAITIGSPTTYNPIRGTSLVEIVFWLSDQSSNRTAIEADINTFYSIF
tara:strand:+ start:1105 stop:2064 length:960 start_codon:yes stop_codon:yes gene_type:complete